MNCDNCTLHPKRQLINNYGQSRDQIAHDVDIAHSAYSACIAKGCGIRWGRKAWVAHDKGGVEPNSIASKSRVSFEISWPFMAIPTCFVSNRLSGVDAVCQSPFCYFLSRIYVYIYIHLYIYIYTYILYIYIYNYIYICISTWRCKLQGISAMNPPFSDADRISPGRGLGSDPEELADQRHRPTGDFTAFCEVKLSWFENADHLPPTFFPHLPVEGC